MHFLTCLTGNIVFSSILFLPSSSPLASSLPSPFSFLPHHAAPSHPPAHVTGGVKVPAHSGSIASGTCVGKRNSQKAVMKKALASTAAKLARISQESPHAVGPEKLSSQPGKVAPVSSGGALVASLPSGGDVGSSYNTSQERAKGMQHVTFFALGESSTFMHECSHKPISTSVPCPPRTLLSDSAATAAAISATVAHQKYMAKPTSTKQRLGKILGLDKTRRCPKKY